MTDLLLFTLGCVAAGMGALWLASLALRNASIVDVAWGPGFAAIAVLGLAFGDGAPARRLLCAALALAWGLRLGVYLFVRNHGKGEDFRYRAMRAHHGARFPLVSLFTVFALQGALMWFVSLPLQVAASATEPATLGVLDALGAALWLVGFAFEAVGDWQLARFKASPANAGAVMDRGLWRYTRHPNYFGDCLVWWGFYAIACSTPQGPFTLLSPALMTFLLLRVSGVALLERTIARRRPGYREYAERTSAFVPRPPKRRV